MKIYLAQENPTVGDIQGNLARLRQIVQENQDADLIVFPELYLAGYPPGDLLLGQGFLARLREAAGALVEFSQGYRSEEHTSELQSRENLVCRLLLEKKKRQIRECN